MPPSIQESKDKCKEIHHLRKLLKIRTKTREENFLTLKTSQKRASFIQQIMFIMERYFYL